MKKNMLTLIIGAMLLSNVVVVSAKTVDTKHSQVNTSDKNQSSINIYFPQSQDPNGW